MIVLFLDLGTATGWAVDHPKGGDEPLNGVVKLTFADPEDPGPGYAQFHGWLCDMIAVHSPRMIAYEAPVPHHRNGDEGGAGTYAIRRLLSLSGIVEMTAAENGIECRQGHIQTIRSFFCGTGRAQKEDVMRECALRGWVAAGPDAGDACAGWAAAKSEGT